MKLTNKLKLSGDQRGFAALIIAIVLVIVLSLLTIGFAELMRHSQTDELNRHLSDQAYYAAESGINDAVRAIHNGFTDEKKDCGPIGPGSPLNGAPGSKYLADNYVDTNPSTQDSPRWTCLLVDPTPSSLAFDSVDTVTPKAFILEPVGPNQMNQLDVYWQGTDNSTNFRSSGYNAATASGAFPAASGSSPLWNSIGMVRMTLTPLPSLDRQSLVNNTYTAYLYPSSDGSANNYGSDSFAPTDANNWTRQGSVINGHCNQASANRYCHARITGIPSNASEKYLLSLRSVYSKTNVYIEGSYNGADVSFAHAQTMIDATGRAQNVLKRLQVRVPDRNDYPYPGFTAEATGGICKALSARPSAVSLSC